MKLFAIEPKPAEAGGFLRQLPSLIDAVGTARFDAVLFAALHDTVGCAHVSAFSRSASAEPHLVLAANAEHTPAARVIARKYLACHWHKDQANHICPDSPRSRAMTGLLIDRRDIIDTGYRKDCYSSARLSARFSLIAQSSRETLRLNVYQPESITFSHSALENLLAASEVILALLARHRQINENDSAPAPRDLSLFENRFHAIAPDLSRREAQVCSMIVGGISSEGIALSLGVSINTVLTYRKRAYARLNVCSQSELMKLILS